MRSNALRHGEDCLINTIQRSRSNVLTLPDDGSGADLYIKMNSRGKPLTDFETFKARFEASVDWAEEAQKRQLSLKFDGAWSDLCGRSATTTWSTFIKYIGFVTEFCEWVQGLSSSGSLGQRAERIFGAANDFREHKIRVPLRFLRHVVGPDGK